MYKLVAATFLLCLVAPSSQAQQRPLPDPKVFLQEVRKHLEKDNERQSGYMYVETRRDEKLDKAGRPTGGSVKVFESYPGLPGEERWERVLSEDGRAVPPQELDKADRERQKHVEEYARNLANDPAQEHAKQEGDLRELIESIDDVFGVFDARMVGRESVDGHDTIVFTLTPRPDANPRTRVGRIARSCSGRVWFSESDRELVRIDVQAVDTLSFGFGMLARVHKGSRALFERRKVNGEAWLPALMRYTLSARVGLVAVMRRGATVEYSNYKKFGVDSTFGVATPPVE